MNRVLFIVMILLYLASNQVSAQSNTGEIAGHVYDPKGVPVPGAIVEVFINGNIKGGAISDDIGFYNIKFIDSGTYDVITRAPEFKSVTAQSIKVDHKRVEVNLKFTAFSPDLVVDIVKWHPPVVDTLSPHCHWQYIKKIIYDITASPGEIAGHVYDNKGNPVPGAIVEVFIDGISKGGAIVDDDGFYRIKPLDSGIYTVTVKHFEFEPYTIKGIKVNHKPVGLNLKFPGINQNREVFGVLWHPRIIDTFNTDCHSHYVKKITSDSTAGTGEIVGHVYGPNSQGMPGLVVVATMGGVVKGTGITDDEGLFHIESLDRGIYDVASKMKRKWSYTVTGVIVNLDKATRVNLKLSNMKTKVLNPVIIYWKPPVLDTVNIR